MSSSAALWVILTCTPSHGNPKAGCREVAPPYTLKDIPILMRNQWMSVNPKNQRKKQVRFNLDEDFGDDPSLPTDLTTFLERSTTKKWDNTPRPSVPLTMDPHSWLMTMASSAYPHTWEELAQSSLSSPQPLLNLNPSPSLGGIPDPVDNSDARIQSQRDKKGDQPQWWKKIRSLCQSCVMSTLSNPKALLLSWCQDVALRLPLAQPGLVGDLTPSDWIASPRLPALHWFPQNKGLPDC